MQKLPHKRNAEIHQANVTNYIQVNPVRSKQLRTNPTSTTRLPSTRSGRNKDRHNVASLDGTQARLSNYRDGLY
eukprot:8903335-Pyramimonas_sp.AAC.1